MHATTTTALLELTMGALFFTGRTETENYTAREVGLRGPVDILNTSTLLMKSKP